MPLCPVRTCPALAPRKGHVHWRVAADNFALECLPAVPGSPFLHSAPNDHGMMHQQLLAKLGMPLGELWRLGPLSRHRKTTGRWDAFISIKPLNITGGTGSPANATAVT
ncbi:hypothetical protein M2428_000668 [Arthrobacter sp. ES3-54]|nr:hypothetical protein [Arthrobacter sp. ES3-54]